MSRDLIELTRELRGWAAALSPSGELAPIRALLTEAADRLQAVEEQGSSRAEEQVARASTLPLRLAQRSAGLAEPYRPVVVHYEEGDYLEYVERDGPTVAEAVTPQLAVMRDMFTRQIIGFRLADWTYLLEQVRPDWPASVQPDSEPADAALQVISGQAPEEILLKPNPGEAS